MIQTAEKQVPSAHCLKNCQWQSHQRTSICCFCFVLLSIFWSVLSSCFFVRLPLSLSFNLLSDLCFLLIFFLSIDFFIAAPTVLIHHFIIYLLKNIIAKSLLFHLCFLLSPLQQDLQVSKSDLGRDVNSLYHSYFYLSLNGLLWKRFFVCLFEEQLFCCSASV